MSFSCMELDSLPRVIGDPRQSEPDKWLSNLASIKIAIICNNKQKSSYIDMGIVSRLQSWMTNESNAIELRTEAVNVLGSLAKGTQENIRSILDANVIPSLLDGAMHSNLKYVEACLRCLRTLIADPSVDTDCVYHNADLMPHLIEIMPKSAWTQECVSTLISHCCLKYENQLTLCNHGAIPALAALLRSHLPHILLPTLASIARLCYRNEQVAYTITATHHNGESIPTILLHFLAGDQKSCLRLGAAKCLTNLYRCRALPIDFIKQKTLPVLVHLCKEEFSLNENLEAAVTIAYLIELSSQLQVLASITDRFVASVSKFLEKAKENTERRDELLEAAFLTCGALSSNDQEIRKKVIDVEDVMMIAIDNTTSCNPRVQIAALKFLGSISRSVHHLRISFHNVTTSTIKSWLQLTQSPKLEIVLASTALLCNLVLEFSPIKTAILDCGGIEILLHLMCHSHSEVRLNTMWALRNMAFQGREQVKTTIMETLAADQDRFFKIISDPCSDVLMKTLSLLRNLLSYKLHIDHLMHKFGIQIMHAIVFILEGDFAIDVKEQTLCVLVNIADGTSAKEYIMGNEDIIKKLMNYLVYSNEKLQIAATECIMNLIWSGDDGCHLRQAHLRDVGVQRMLHQLQSTTSTDSPLHERVMRALQQFAS